MCEKEHSNHKLITYGSIMPDINIAKDELENMKKTINETKNDIIHLVLAVYTHYIHKDSECELYQQCFSWCQISGYHPNQHHILIY